MRRDLCAVCVKRIKDQQGGFVEGGMKANPAVTTIKSTRVCIQHVDDVDEVLESKAGTS